MCKLLEDLDKLNDEYGKLKIEYEKVVTELERIKKSEKYLEIQKSVGINNGDFPNLNNPNVGNSNKTSSSTEKNEDIQKLKSDYKKR